MTVSSLKCRLSVSCWRNSVTMILTVALSKVCSILMLKISETFMRQSVFLQIESHNISQEARAPPHVLSCAISCHAFAGPVMQLRSSHHDAPRETRCAMSGRIQPIASSSDRMSAYNQPAALQLVFSRFKDSDQLDAVVCCTIYIHVCTVLLLVYMYVQY